MKLFSDVSSPEVASLLNAGGIGIVRTDTLYGVVARADDERAVQRIYELKGRDDTKSTIVLIASSAQIFDEVSATVRAVCRSRWPGKVSIIIPSVNAPVWLRRGNDSVAYRLPARPGLIELLQKTGPLIAPSANPQGAEPAQSIDEAVEYFGEAVDFYVDEGHVSDSTPSQLLRIEETGEVTRLR